MKKLFTIILLLAMMNGSSQRETVSTSANGEASIKLKITERYLNIPIGHTEPHKTMVLRVGNTVKREFPVQLAEAEIGYWTYMDMREFIGKKITISCPVQPAYLNRIYQSKAINGADSLYRESNRPQFHFSVKRGWSNDVNGPVYYKGQYHLFWQSYPFGLLWNSHLYWGHAVSKDLLHWKELGPALLPDSLGSPWSGSAVIDRNNTGGWGKNALVLYYTAYDRFSNKQVQCIAYSTDNGKTFSRYMKNPVIDSNREMGTNDTRDPKVFWYEPTQRWIMVLYEKDGMSFYNSTDMKAWIKQSHFSGLHECPDFFELPVDGDSSIKKWILHGGSSEYFIGTFDGRGFTAESPKLIYAEGKTGENRAVKEDILYAGLTFENMPDNRRVQMAWGRIFHDNMPFTQIMLFPTRFHLKNTPDGLRLAAEPIHEINQLHNKTYSWVNIRAEEVNKNLAAVRQGPLHITMKVKKEEGKALQLLYGGNELLSLQSNALPYIINDIELLIDKSVAEIFVNGGERYILKQLSSPISNNALEFKSENALHLEALSVHEMKSIWPVK